MMKVTKPFPYDILEADDSNVKISIELLTKHGIFELYQRHVPQLFAGLVPAAEKAAPAGYFPFTRLTAGGIEIPTYDFILRLTMLQSAHEQFIFATGHLFRAHASEVPSHLRKAAEAAGIAYLSKSRPELGEIFLSGDEKKFRNATNTKAILPPDDPVTADLFKSVNFASMLTHNNAIGFAQRTKSSIRIVEKKWTVSLGLDFYGSTTLPEFLRLALLSLRIMERVLRVLGTSLDVPATSDWSKELGQFEARLNKLYVDLDHIVRPNDDGTDRS
jgi:hypothetical protein